MPDVPGGDWCTLKETFVRTAPHQLLTFSNAHITYFIVMLASDFKAINKSSLNLFKCGHDQDIMIAFDKHVCIQAKCLPEMRKDWTYKLLLVLELDAFDIVAAECGCPAGKGPYGSSKHIGALCYALEDFSSFGRLPDFLTSTDQLQQ